MSKLTALEHMQALAERVRDYFGLKLVELTTATVEAVTELDAAKADVTVRTVFSVPVSGWGSSGNTAYPYKATLAVDGVDINTRADVVLDVTSANAAGAAGVCSVAETVAGGVVLLAKYKPTAEIKGEMYLEQSADASAGKG